MIECISIYGHKVLVPKSKLIFRPSVYSIIVNDGKVLLIKSRHGGRCYLPGGGINPGEKIEVALRRELKEETGLEVEVAQFVHFQEDFFYYDPSDEAYHSLLFYYICIPRTIDLVDDDRVEDEDAEQPRWVETGQLQAQDFQNHGKMILGFLELSSIYQ